MRLVKVTPNSMHYEVERGSGVYVARIYARRTPTFSALALLRGAIRDPLAAARLFAMLPFATVVSLPNPTSAGIDAKIVDDFPTTNYGTANHLAFGRYNSTEYHRTLIDFSLAANIPAGATISSTVLTVTLAYAGYAMANNSFGVYRIRRAWTEASATWNTYDGTHNWGTAGCDNTTSDREAASIGTSQTFLTTDAVGTSHTCSITGANVAALDLGYGWILIGTSETVNAAFYPASSDHATAGYRPLLTVTYTVPGGGIFNPPFSGAFRGPFG